jgi:hypothetical protein
MRVWELDGATPLQAWGPELAPLVPLMDHGRQATEQVVQASLRRSLDVSNPRLREAEGEIEAAMLVARARFEHAAELAQRLRQLVRYPAQRLSTSP